MPVRHAPRAPRRVPAAPGLIAAALLLAGLTGCAGQGSPVTSPSGFGGPTSSAAPSSSSAPMSATPASSTPASTSGSASGTASPSTSTAASSARAAAGSLVDGFPTGLIPVMEGSTIRSSSYNVTPELATASLIAATPQPPQAVMDYYVGALTAEGFNAVAGDQVAGTASRNFVRSNGAETINITAVQDAGQTVYTIGANVPPTSMK